MFVGVLYMYVCVCTCMCVCVRVCVCIKGSGYVMKGCDDDGAQC